ncbi:hypothetical protein CAEBREN_18478 [Caenorhabditis brenneri]|uniref:Uncharacterized protein n=1 Tax=Caenorhabditis brenneri TaxID=135651 RepID=G0PA34_CAEBE|nr:hypothetical protein CAEBREN_18478 [Caenorhabditis brenneri]
MNQQNMDPAPFRSLADLHKLNRRKDFFCNAKTGTGAQKLKAVKKPKSKADKGRNQEKPAKLVLQSWNDAKEFFFNKYPGEFMKEFDFTKLLFDFNGMMMVPQLVEPVFGDVFLLKKCCKLKVQSQARGKVVPNSQDAPGASKAANRGRTH